MRDAREGNKTQPFVYRRRQAIEPQRKRSRPPGATIKEKRGDRCDAKEGTNHQSPEKTLEVAAWARKKFERKTISGAWELARVQYEALKPKFEVGVSGLGSKDDQRNRD
ncbi:unnamed protein product [Arabidopsis lyrata]|nr:unnamed protein product [Arabidopsis lyrata]